MIDGVLINKLPTNHGTKFLNLNMILLLYYSGSYNTPILFPRLDLFFIENLRRYVFIYTRFVACHKYENIMHAHSITKGKADVRR